MNKLHEKSYLDYVVNSIQNRLSVLNSSISKQERFILDLKKDIWNNAGETDSIEIMQKKQESESAIEFIEKDILRRDVLKRLLSNPYFAKINYTHQEVNQYNYIGLSAFLSEDLKLLICDWRSPIASLFYDFELGKASYETPKGRREVMLISKNQFKISNSLIEYMVDTSMQVSDDILIEELSKNKSTKMRNIVNTIQREQNHIIRNEKDDILIIQGVAGSGKTSIALHRISFLLYRNRDSIKSNGVLIFSPSKVFSDYISKVLPELGEENIIEISFNEYIKSELLKMDFDINSVDFNTPKNYNIISMVDINLIKSFVEYKEKAIFNAKDFNSGTYCIDAKFISDLYYRKYKDIGFLSRIDYIYDIMAYKHEGDLNVDLNANDKKDLMSFVKSMYTTTNVADIYCDFKLWLKTNYDYSSIKPFDSIDIYKMIFLNNLISKSDEFADIKHLIIDEMQDYSLIHYEIIKGLFDCPMTILGDIYQNMNNNCGIRAIETFNDIFNDDFKVIELTKSYRSTLEIMELAKHVLNNKIDIIERHGNKPTINVQKTPVAMFEKMCVDIRVSLNRDQANCAILCKSSEQVNAIYDYLNGKLEICKITENSNRFEDGLIVTTVDCAKGLEYDSVFIPYVDLDNYKNQIDRNILYVACTRALHDLHIYSHSGTISDFLEKY